ncbi:GTP 3',8-cyclase MoaA [Desulfonatronovibrio hydrogenovorans]|uniref:GTP 3',8-cyclase MoaA n=1 Tax=Desulfonatronovibrio hydrogenovorans TaxID=53245 RepID=UPI000491B541|nr:GTP 3',8-cyclase MoaA [Desulfonatronovibrio hydrogenovorans]
MIRDNYGRTISYLRLSITDRCNLNCFYCRPCKVTSFIPHNNILTYEDMYHLLETAAKMDVQKVRLTGGEPFARRDILYFLSRIKSGIPGMDLRLTTNATLIAGKIKALKDVGIEALNISLDTLDRDKYQKITGRDFLKNVLTSIERCLEHGIRVKINVVALKGVNDDELENFVGLALSKPVDVRFIEFMPIGQKTLWRKQHFWPGDAIVSAAEKVTRLEPLSHEGKNHGPARIYALPEGAGRLGIISPLSNHFCETCNRLRITADGRLRTCLFSDRDYRLLPLIRSSKISPERLKTVLERAGLNKPMGNELAARDRGPEKSLCQRVMSSIGG